MHRANVSVGPLLLTYRTSDLGPPFGNGGTGVRDQAILAGLRTGGHRAFGSAALGYARAEQYETGGAQCSAPQACTHAGAMAVDLSLHVNWLVPGLAVSYSGTVGPAPVAYSAYTLALELGWFGR